MGITQQLVQEFVQARFPDIPGPAARRVKEAVLDDVGIAFLGYATVGGPLVAYAKDVGGGRRESTLIGDGARVTCMAAAGANAQMAYDTDFNETGPGHHIMSALAQTAIAVGERAGASGQDVLAAVATGYEMSGRFHYALLPALVARGEGKRHIPICVAMTAGKLLGLSETQMNHAIGIAWYFQCQASEFNWRNLWWKRLGNFHLGNCQLGIQAALLAQHGFQGPTDVIEKEVFYDVPRLGESPSPYYYPASELDMKPWISSRANHPGIQAALEMVKEEGIQVENIDKLTFRGSKLYRDYPFNNPRPTEHWDAIYSVQWAFALSLLGYQPGPAWLSPERLADPRCLALAQKVVTEVDPNPGDESSTSGLLINEYANEVEIAAGGKRWVRRKSSRETLGSPRNPMNREQLVRKFKAQATPVIGDKQSDRLADTLLALEGVSDIRAVTRLFAAVASVAASRGKASSAGR